MGGRRGAARRRGAVGGAGTLDGWEDRKAAELVRREKEKTGA
jgi:hypothetical protein